MDGCPRQNPAYRPATGRAPSEGRVLFVAAALRSRAAWLGRTAVAGFAASARTSAGRTPSVAVCSGAAGRLGPLVFAPPTETADRASPPQLRVAGAKDRAIARCA